MYCEATGQLINYQKSYIIFGAKVDDITRTEIKDKLGIHVEDGDGSYLGLPECFSGSKRKLMSFILRKLNKRLQGWFSKALSQGGKEILLKSIALALPVYAMSCFKLSQDLCQKLKSAMIQYWWSSGNNKKKISWVAWEKLCQDKDHGGLGFHDIALFKQSLLGKQAWRLVSSHDSLVSKIMKSRYFVDVHFLAAETGLHPSYAWRSILHGRELLSKGMVRSIGNGGETYAFIARWMFDNGTRTPVRTEVDVNPMMRVVDFIHRETWTWNEALVRAVFIPADATRILSLKISSNISDSFIWCYTKHGRYTSQSGYKLLAEAAPHLANTCSPIEKALWSKIWKIPTSPKLRHFLWKILHGALAVADRLQTRGVDVSSQCPMCNTGIESIPHVLFTCPVAVQVWELSELLVPVGGFSSNSAFVNLHFLMERTSSNSALVEFHWILWQIWKARNAMVFERIKWSPEVVYVRVKDDATEGKAVNVVETSVRVNSQATVRWCPPQGPFLKCNVASVRVDALRCVGDIRVFGHFKQIPKLFHYSGYNRM